jgi:organic radical activating enzyme
MIMVSRDSIEKYTDQQIDSDGYGWEQFTLASNEAKRQYIASLLYYNFDNLPTPLVKIIAEAITYTDVSVEDSYVPHRYIDHQSVITLPCDFGTDHPSIDFITDFNNYVLRDNIIILGGNDNCEDDECHPYSGDSIKDLLPVGLLPREEDNTHYSCRKDGDWWTLHNRINGNRIVLSFEDEPAEYRPITPMLVDLKITDFCPYGCEFCYQGSTVVGGHMSENHIYKIADMLSKAKVFEVAIGGGEPTLFPKILTLIETIRGGGVMPNLTTKNLTLIRNDSMRDRVFSNVGAVAFSVSNEDEIKRIIIDAAYYDIPEHKVVFQIIPDIIGHTWTVVQLIRAAKKHPVTLLGYKTTERGKDCKRTKVDLIELLRTIRKENIYSKLSIDTVLAKEYDEQLRECDIPVWLYHIHEGMYSMYIDATTMKYGPCSYAPDMMFDLNKLSIEEAFANVVPI